MRSAARLVLLAALVAASAPTADAQLGGLINRARAAVTGETERPGDAPRPADGSPLPAVDFGDLLDTRFYPSRGTFGLGDVFMLFPPAGLTERDEIRRSRFVIRDASGGEAVRTTIGRATPTGSAAIVRLHMRAGVVGDRDDPVEPGTSYTLDVELDGALVGSMPFTVSQSSNGDPYNPVTTLVLDGPWRTHAYFEHQTERPDYLMHFNAWVGTDDAPSNVPTEVSIRKDGQEVAFGHGFTNSTYGWHRVEHRLFDVSGRDDRFGRHKTNASSWTIEDVTPGTYEIVLSHEGGEIRRYEIEGGSGAFVAHPRSALDVQPRHRFLGARRMTDQNLRTAHTLYWIGPEE